MKSAWNPVVAAWNTNYSRHVRSKASANQSKAARFRVGSGMKSISHWDMELSICRRRFFQISASLVAGFHTRAWLHAEEKPLLFKISLAQWSLHRALYLKKLSNL